MVKKVIQENEPTTRQTRQAKDFVNAASQLLGIPCERSHLSFEVLRLAFANFFSFDRGYRV